MIAESVRREIAAGVVERLGRGLRAPGLAVVLVGVNPASQSYVKSKSRAALEIGFHSVQRNLPLTVSEAELLGVVREFNNDPLIDGILVQLPLPSHISEQQVIETISPAKDVDGFHPESAGRLSLGLPGFVPCTPLGVKEMLLREKIETVGKFAVVIGRSNIVGKPMANLLWSKGVDATVALAHSRTRDLAELCRRADILVAAIGKPRAITADMIKPGAVVIDVGINRIDDSGTKTGYRLVGDVDFEGAVKVAGAITPVPGGVGPMTIAMLMRNTFESAAHSR